MLFMPLVYTSQDVGRLGKRFLDREILGGKAGHRQIFNGYESSVFRPVGETTVSGKIKKRP